MFSKVFSEKLSRPKRKKQIGLLTTALIFGALFPVNLVYAEETTISNDANTASENSNEKSQKSNESILNYLESEDYLITAERIPSSKWETPANIHVITAQEIEENHYQTVEEALSHVNGIVTILSGAATNGEVLMNGNGRVLLLINGHRANNTQDGFTARKSELSVIPSMKIIERIEIVKGGSSALYGTDAVDGVINIITKKGTRNETTVDLNAGSWHRYNAEITNQGVSGDFSWFVSGGLGGSHAYHYKGSSSDVLSDNSDYKDNDFTIRMDNQFNERNSLTLEMLHRTHKYNGKSYSGLYNNFSMSYNFKETTSVPGWFRYYNDYRTTHTSLSEGHVDARIQGFEYQNGWELGQHKIIAGLEYHQNKLDQKYYNIKDKKQNNSAFYIQDTMKFGEKWTVIPGTRYDHSNKYGSNWSPKISANYQPDKKTKFYASWGRVYREPTINETYTDNLERYVNGLSNFLYWGSYSWDDTYLRSEKGHTETIGIEHDFDENTNINLNFFSSNMSDAIRWQPNIIEMTGTYLFPFISDNSITEKRRGVELTFKQKVGDHFAYNIGYSHTKIDNEIPSSLEIEGLEVDNTYGQPNGYRIGLHYNNKNLRANLLGVMASGLSTTDKGYFADSGFISDRYAILNFNLSYDVNEHATIYFKANNFTNQNFSNISRVYHSPGKFFMSGVTLRF